MRYLIVILSLVVALASCESSKSTTQAKKDTAMVTNDTIRIANEDLEYEILIIEPGFDAWMVTQKPRGFYGQSYLEGKNMLFVTEYNRRVQNFQQYSRITYEMEIDYKFGIDYGYEVNYLLYNYFIYFQKEYDQRLTASAR